MANTADELSVKANTAVKDIFTYCESNGFVLNKDRTNIFLSKKAVIKYLGVLIDQKRS